MHTINPLTTVDEYLAAVPAEMRATLERMREAIRIAAPDAMESISYGMPGYKYRGRPLIAFAAWKTHCAIYGFNVAAYPDELAGYEESGKGTVRFTPDRPLPSSSIAKLVRARMREIDATLASRRSR